ncbi:MAG: Carbon-nitrogen hydrolase, partial [Bacteroidota bacterium]|nr:Carbon-nitrogen hydrolase [Bacteroidota bacterium]
MKIAMAQLLVEGGEPERNLERAEKLIRQAKAEGAELVLLPE